MRLLPLATRYSLLATVCALAQTALCAQTALRAQPDIVIYGATSAGLSAAVQAARMGKSAIIVEPGNHIGGMTTGGLGQTDIGNKRVIGGIALEFYKDIRKYYDNPAAWKWQPAADYKSHGQSATSTGEIAQWTFEPSAAQAVYNQWIRQHNITIITNERLDRRPNGITMQKTPTGTRIAAFRTESGREFRAKMFIDATYEGDLMALAGVSYTVGREANAVHNETLNGVQTLNSINHNMFPSVDPRIRKGDPTSGLLPHIDPAGPGVEGSGDHRVQAYCFRMCLTDHPNNRVPFAKPVNYRDDWYELLFRNLEAAPDTAAMLNWIWINAPMPNRKTDTNNRGGVSTDFIGQNYDYPEADYATREKIIRQHLLWQQGLMWTLAYHPRTPAPMRELVSKWGLTKDEFTETAGWPPQLYVREARRMVGALVMTQHHCQGAGLVDDSIGMAAYTMDSHNTQRYVDSKGHARNEGNVEVSRRPDGKPFAPYPVSYRSIIPREGECENLLVPVCMSASHIAYGSIRMEPVFMIFGQSAATAAAIAIDNNLPLQKLPYQKLRARLQSDSQILTLPPAVPPPPKKQPAPNKN